MRTYYLKAATGSELKSALDDAGLCITGEDGNISYYGNCGDYILDWVGEIYEPTGVTLTDSGGNEYPEMASVGGYHINIYSNIDLPSSLQPLTITAPATPARMLATAG